MLSGAPASFLFVGFPNPYTTFFLWPLVTPPDRAIVTSLQPWMWGVAVQQQWGGDVGDAKEGGEDHGCQPGLRPNPTHPCATV